MRIFTPDELIISIIIACFICIIVLNLNGVERIINGEVVCTTHRTLSAYKAQVIALYRS